MATSKGYATYPKISNIKLAELLAISEGYVRKLRKKLEKHEATRTGSRPNRSTKKYI